MKRKHIKISFLRSFLPSRYKDDEMRKKVEQKIDHELDIVKLVKTIRSVKIMKKMLLNDFTQKLIPCNKMSFVSTEEAYKPSDPKKEWFSFINKM